MDTITINKIEKSDNQIVAKIIRSVFEEFDAPKTCTVYSDVTTDDLYTLFQTPKSVLWVARVNNEIAGCCGIYPTEGLDNGVVELVKYYVSKHTRGTGVGKKLFLKSIVSAKELGYKQIYLESFPQFSKALHIYEKFGFRYIDSPLGNSGHTGCTIWMIKDI